MLPQISTYIDLYLKVKDKRSLKIFFSTISTYLLEVLDSFVCLSHLPNCVLEFILSVVSTLHPVPSSPYCPRTNQSYAFERKLSVATLWKSKFTYPVLRMNKYPEKMNSTWCHSQQKPGLGWKRGEFVFEISTCVSLGQACFSFLGAQHCLLVTWKVHLCIFKPVVHTSVRHNACAGE